MGVGVEASLWILTQHHVNDSTRVKCTNKFVPSVCVYVYMYATRRLVLDMLIEELFNLTGLRAQPSPWKRLFLSALEAVHAKLKACQ